MRTALFVSVLAVASIGFAQDSFTLKRSPKEGDSAKYQLKVDTEISGLVVKFSATVTEKVTKVKEDGSFTVSSEQSDTVLEINGEKQETPPGVGGAETSTFATDGHVSDIQGDETGSDSYRMANIQSMLWPKEAVTIGSKWEADIKEDSAKGYPAVHAKYEVLAKETMGERTVLKISFSSTETGGTDPAASKGTTWVDVSNGLVVKTEAEWTNAPVAGQKINGKVTMTLV